MVNNTLVNAFFEEIKKSTKAQFAQAAKQLGKPDIKISYIRKASRNILEKLDTNPTTILEVLKGILDTNEKNCHNCFNLTRTNSQFLSAYQFV